MVRNLALFGSGIALALALVACSHSQPLQILHSAPDSAYRTLGMLSGQGPNEASAMQEIVRQAEQMGADAVVVVGQRPVGKVVIVTAKAIAWTGPPPGQAPPPQ